MGILLSEEFVTRGSVKERQIEMRKRHGQEIEVYKVAPIYPKCKWKFLFLYTLYHTFLTHLFSTSTYRSVLKHHTKHNFNFNTPF